MQSCIRREVEYCCCRATVLVLDFDVLVGRRVDNRTVLYCTVRSTIASILELTPVVCHLRHPVASREALTRIDSTRLPVKMPPLLPVTFLCAVRRLLATRYLVLRSAVYINSCCCKIIILYLRETIGSTARDPSLSRIPRQTFQLRAIGNCNFLAQVYEHSRMLLLSRVRSSAGPPYSLPRRWVSYVPPVDPARARESRHETNEQKKQPFLVKSKKIKSQKSKVQYHRWKVWFHDLRENDQNTRNRNASKNKLEPT